ncbi:MAG: MFS transporter [Micrococcaceae bacterium]
MATVPKDMTASEKVKLIIDEKVKAMQEKEDDGLEGIKPEIYKKRWAILVTVCIALLGVMLANSSINLALPEMSVDLGLTQITMTWIANTYTLVFASLLFFAGAFGDRYGRKLALQIGSIIFTAASLYAGFFAKTGEELIAARAVMGLGGALVMPTTLSIINNVFPSKERPRAVAIWSGISGAGMMLGTIVSGILLEHFSWKSLFFLSAIIAGIGLIINQIFVPENKDEEANNVDWLGGVLATIGIFGLIYGITEAPDKGLGDHLVQLGLIGGLVSIISFYFWERKTSTPLLDMDLFKNRAFLISTITLIFTFLAMMGLLFSTSQLQQLIMGMTPFDASLTLIPMILPILLLAPIVPTIVKKAGARITISTGLFLISISFVFMHFWTKDLSLWQMLWPMMLLMTGLALAMTPGTNILMSSVPRNRSGMGSAMNDTTRELGGALGVAILGSIISSAYKTNIHPHLAALPEQARTAIEGSLAAGLHVFGQMGPAGASLVDTAKTAWMDAFQTSSLVAAAISFVTAAVALLFLPKATSIVED